MAVVFKKTLWLLLILGALLAVLLAFFYLYTSKKYDQRLYPRLFWRGSNLAGLSQNETERIFIDRTTEIGAEGFRFSYQDYWVTIPNLSAVAGPDLSQPLFYSLSAESAQQAYQLGRASFDERLWIWLFGKQLSWQYYLDEQALNKELTVQFAKFLTPVKEADLLPISNDQGDMTGFQLQTEAQGFSIDFAGGLKQLKTALAKGENPVIELSGQTIYPQKLATAVPQAPVEAWALLNNRELVLKFQESSSTPLFSKKLSSWELAGLIGLEKKNGSWQAAWSPEKVSAFLNTQIAPQINREPARAKFEMQGTKVSLFQIADNGIALDVPLNTDNIIQTLEQQRPDSWLVVQEIVDQSAEKINEFGIKEIIGTGHSNFVGSPKNRRHNISVGAQAISGLLIAPNEEFSLVKALGEINAESGYLPELVIKENRTIPEYGGGLCQIGTTVFRAAIYSGLPITMRRSHSYRVSYYEPAGMDAAVYDPYPDVRFLNDTSNYILIQSRFNGDDIYFDFWGLKDGRQVNISKPVVYNLVKPAATRIVETTDLPVGERKCTEKAHTGADAYFDYQVIYHPQQGDEESKQVRFSSHYVPWQEVCLVGIKASTTEEIAN